MRFLFGVHYDYVTLLPSISISDEWIVIDFGVWLIEIIML